MQRETRFVKDVVSVVTPVYNGEKYLSRLLDSILCQSWDSMEIIVSDDGSTDGTLAVAESYREKFRRRGFAYTIISSPHKNASAAINQGLPLVNGEFLIWPDSDDFLDRDSVRKRVMFLRENPQYQCVRSLSRYRDEAGREAPAEETRGDLQKQELFFPILESETFVCCGCYMLRSEPFFAIYPQRKIPEYGVGQNFQMLLPFCYFHRCPTIPEELYTVLVRPESHSRRQLTFAQEEKKYSDYEKLIDEIIDICRICSAEELRRLRLWKCRRRYWLAVQYRKKAKAFFALFAIYQCGGVGFFAFLKSLAGIFCGSKFRSFYHKLKKKKKNGAKAA